MQYYIHTHIHGKGKWESLSAAVPGFWQRRMMKNKFHLTHSVLSVSACLSFLTCLTQSSADMSGHYPGLDCVTSYQLQSVSETFRWDSEEGTSPKQNAVDLNLHFEIVTTFFIVCLSYLHTGCLWRVFSKICRQRLIQNGWLMIYLL